MRESGEPVTGDAGAFSKEELQRLSHLYGVNIEEGDLEEVTWRMSALLEEMEKLKQLDLSQVEPIPMFLPEKEK